MIISIFKRHIDKGILKNPRFCPIGRAITEQTGLQVAVQYGKVFEIYTAKELATLPTDVYQKYIKYDHTGQMKPFEFDLELYDEEINENSQVATA